MNRTDRTLAALSLAWLAALVASGLAPYDRATWAMEVLPAVIALPILWATRARFAFTTLVYVAIAVHGLILIYGGAHTYARVPLGFWLQDMLGTERNPYDKIGHFAQGFVPALVAREILLRGFRLPQRQLVAFLAVCICLAISASYDLIEWAAAVSMGQGADEFLGTQGDEWDTQSDMMWALIGALIAVYGLARWHDRAMARMS